MKKCFYYMLIATLLATVFALTSCSSDEPTFEPTGDEFGMNAISNELGLMLRTANNDGSWDNIVDGSSCIGIQFPYTVAIRGVDITIESVEDLQVIEDIFDAVDDDEDMLQIIFPITITQADYSEIIINDDQALRALVAQCVEGGADDDIECIDFSYPIRLFVFDPNLEKTSAVTVNSDSELRRFFTGLSATDLVDVDFPISLETHDDTKVTATNYVELKGIIEKAIDACDEDDDNDYGDDDFTQEQLDSRLVECQWLIKEVERGYEDATTDFETYFLDFDEDGSVDARDREGNILEGKWSTRVSEYRVLVTLDFQLLTQFNLEWFVDDIANDSIKLFASEGDKIIMRQLCDEQTGGCTEDFIKEVLETCIWIPSQDENSFLDDLSIDFSNSNIHVRNANGEIVDEGNWGIEGTILVFNNLSMELANYIGEWEVIECNIVRFKLQRGEETLVIEKECE